MSKKVNNIFFSESTKINTIESFRKNRCLSPEYEICLKKNNSYVDFIRFC